jgi:putative nucleotidyltransferase with HDIG domain
MDEEIKRAFPVIEEIRNEELRDTVYRAWRRGLSECSFDAIDEIPFSAGMTEPNLVAHTCWVADAALSLAALVEKGMNIPIDRDLLIAAALLHDLGKAFEFKKAGDGYEKSKIGEQFMHGFWGAHIALLEGASQDLAHLISTHCHVSPVPPRLIEGVILHYADFAHADILRFQRGMDMFL